MAGYALVQWYALAHIAVVVRPLSKQSVTTVYSGSLSAILPMYVGIEVAFINCAGTDLESGLSYMY